MERRGVGFDREAHAALLEDLKERRLELEERFEAACIEAGKPDLASGGVPSTPAGKAKLLAALLTPEELEAWPVTPKGLAKSTKRADLRRGAHHAPIAVLAEFGIVGKQLTSFGPTLAAFVHDGRIHASLQRRAGQYRPGIVRQPECPADADPRAAASGSAPSMSPPPATSSSAATGRRWNCAPRPTSPAMSP